MNPDMPDDVILPGGEVVPLPLTTANPFEFFGFALQVQIKIHEAMMQDGVQLWRILSDAVLQTGAILLTGLNQVDRSAPVRGSPMPRPDR